MTSSAVQDEEETTTTTATTSSFLEDVPLGPPDAILGIASAFRACTAENKVNVCVGAYRDENGKPWVLPSVRKAEELLLQSPTQNKEYAPIDGDAAFCKLALEFAYGKDCSPLQEGRVAGVQTLSGTGACRLAGDFLSNFCTSKQILIPTPTWGNHIAIFKKAGLEVNRYRHYNYKTNGMDWDGLVEDLTAAPDKSIVLLHACAHNPTGCDPTLEQWKELSSLCKTKQFVVLFDSAYQGFASGDAERDARALRLFLEDGHLLLLAQSFAKNFGLYGERCGTLSVVCASAQQKEAVQSQLKLLIRPMYSSPPIHGSSIVKTVLQDDALTTQYRNECSGMAERIGAMRAKLVDALAKAGSTHDWSHVTTQIGMFAFTGMSADMCDELTAQYNIFLTRDGRISVAGLNDGNLQYVANAIHAVTDGKSITK